MSTAQYDAYCKLFGVLHAISPVYKGRRVPGIGGEQTPSGSAKIQIPFKNLHIIVDVHFLILSNDIPTLMSMKELIQNDLDIYLKDK